MEQTEVTAVLEAVLFAHADPVGADKLAAALEWPESLVREGLAALQARYTQPGSGLTLLRLGDHWQLATKNEYGDYVRRTLETKRAAPLSQAALETLTVIAYNQPVSRAFIEQVRGVDSSSSVASLLEKGLIEEAGRLDLPQMEELIRRGDFGMVIDATHPYAAQVSRQIRALCDSLGLPLLRCLRPVYPGASILPAEYIPCDSYCDHGSFIVAP